MTKENERYGKLTNEQKIDEKASKIKILFKQAEKDKMQFIDNLIHQFAFTAVTLERLVKDLNSESLTEDFRQGSQSFRRENTSLKAYNTTIKSFSMLSRQLIDLLPETSSKQAGESLMNFVARPPIISVK